MSHMEITDRVVQNEMDKNGFKAPANIGKSGRVLDGPTCLYRHFDEDGNLLYVGISLSAVERLRGHRVDSHWFDQIAVITVQRFETRHKACIAEDMAIALENPLHNIQRVDCAAFDYNLFDPEEAKIHKARVLRRLRAKLAETHAKRRKRLKGEIEAAGMTSVL